MSTADSIAIIMTSRERYSLTGRSIGRLYATTDLPFDLSYVDSGSPPEVRDEVRRLADQHGFVVHRVEALISPNHARNVGIRSLPDGYRYVVFVDNDVDFHPGWLEALVRCAEDEGADVVGPLYLEGPLADEVVHMAGGDMAMSGNWGTREFQQTQRHFLTKLADVPRADLRRQECDIIEFHCALVRRDILDKAGWMDEGLLTTREHLDFCLRVQAVGGRIFFEPASVMTYLTPPPLHRRDLRYFLVRWSDQWTRETLVHFAHKYGITPAYVDRVAKTRARRHRILLGWLVGGDRGLVGRAVGAVVRTIEPWWAGGVARRALRRLTDPRGVGPMETYVGTGARAGRVMTAGS